MMRGDCYEAEGASAASSREAFLGLGSNLGDRAATLALALRMLDARDDCEVLQLSSVYETEPVGMIDQPAFLNMVAQVRSELQPEELLDALQEIESRLGRVRTVADGPRTIDLDILLYEDLRVSSPRLTVPHPELVRRQFVLVPLAEIAPHLPLPGGRTAQEMSAGESAAVRRLGSLEEVAPDSRAGSA